jgi:flagellar basal body-associated protein FliL
MRWRNFQGVPGVSLAAWTTQQRKDRMRAIILILILVVVAFIVAIATGFLHISQTRTAAAPDVSVNSAGVSASGGRAPAFDVETGSVSVGTNQRRVKVPMIQVNPPGTANRQDQNVAGNAG